jgi:CheY-like chemotaxis protein
VRWVVNLYGYGWCKVRFFCCSVLSSAQSPNAANTLDFMASSDTLLPKHLLVVEDSEDDQFLLQRALDRLPSHCRLTCTMVGNGVHAQDYIMGVNGYHDRKKFPMPVLVLADIKMPICDGFQLLGWIRARVQCSDLPVVIFSSSSEACDVRRAYGLKANTYFTKPHGVDDLNAWACNFAEYWCSRATLSPPV